MQSALPENGSLSGTIQCHMDLCEEVYQLMLDENRALKASGQPPEESLLNRKRALLARLDVSLERLKQVGAQQKATTSELRTALEKGQQSILRALLLDRENEQLLLKSTAPPRVALVAPRMAASQLERVYGRHR